jgi:hypothetical protein
MVYCARPPVRAVVLLVVLALVAKLATDMVRAGR